MELIPQVLLDDSVFRCNSLVSGWFKTIISRNKGELYAMANLEHCWLWLVLCSVNICRSLYTLMVAGRNLAIHHNCRHAAGTIHNTQQVKTTVQFTFLGYFLRNNITGHHHYADGACRAIVIYRCAQRCGSGISCRIRLSAW